MSRASRSGLALASERVSSLGTALDSICGVEWPPHRGSDRIVRVKYFCGRGLLPVGCSRTLITQGTGNKGRLYGYFSRAKEIEGKAMDRVGEGNLGSR